jgi:hypothetical protein
MKQQENKIEEQTRDCEQWSCSSCAGCSLVNFEEAGELPQPHAAQLYGTEAEHYFFYFPPGRKAG